MMGQQEKDRILRLAKEEHAARQDYFQHLELPLPYLISIVWHLQMTLLQRVKEHGYQPLRDIAARQVTDTIDQIIRRLKEDGLPRNAEYLEIGQLPPPEDQPQQ